MREFARESNYYRVLSSRLIKDLNEAQKSAVMHGEGPALVAAGPGSGKTTVIIRRLLYLIYVRNIPSEKILVITFTKEAAKSMQNRFIKELEAFGFGTNYHNSSVSFGTFHSFFYQIIRSIQKYSEYQMITQQEKINIATKVLSHAVEGQMDYNVKRFLEKLSYYKNTGTYNEEEELKKMIDMYQSITQKQRKMDFDDMLFLCWNELKNQKEVVQYWQNRFEFVMIDEYQDIGPVQSEIMKILCKETKNLFVVGDDDQAIYGFRGSDTLSFQHFMKDYRITTPIYLTDNYRCSQAIVEASKKLIEKNQMRLTKELRAVGKSLNNGVVMLEDSIHYNDTYNKIIQELENKSKEELDEEAVLFRTNSSLQMFASRLAGRNIPFVLREKFKSIYEHFLIRDIMDYFSAAHGCLERSLFLRILQKQGIFMGREVLKTQQVNLERIKESFVQEGDDGASMLKKVEILERHLKRLKAMRPHLGIQYILHAMDYKGYLMKKQINNETMQEWQQILEWLLEDSREYSTYQLWKEHQECYEEQLKKEHGRGEQETMQKEPQGIHLLTMHASKGLEFRKVYIVNLNDGTVPQIRRGESIDQSRIEEERRLLYVGMTRAKEELQLHYMSGTKENPKLRSRFLDEIFVQQ